ncbi:MAG TPA: Tol-Pal system protein TolB [Pseudomonas sabulinigri]|mgnify:FL=1|jgi:TolB protein|uniref:TolB N-terminal domain-containing protein n=1 Tax=marine sediment metagenome TaxID=412755 RepID=A0A0F9XZS2_9ZZZZ|nr:Tol-Pal system protein TolB [Halopseudomonas sabulinigri]HEC51116.1 Tol-Pal system protein TolB [Halopseudomonas sabulinigri]|tara:strand:+ start:943 stop:2247 length:1305 start_codon:yes stop_codon:yes gene_type:complete
MKRFTQALIAVIALCAAQMTLAQEAIEITKGTDKATPIAVVPFGWQGSTPLPEDLAQISANDLRNSGMFAPMERSNMLSYPVRGEEINARDWKMIGVDYVVVGQVSNQAGTDRYELNYSLYSIVREQVLLSKTVSGTKAQLRDMAHHLSDEVFEEITGIKGAYNTKLLYVAAERFSKDNTRYTLQRSDYDGARLSTLLQSREPILSPSYAPDGQRIAYVSFESGRPEIYVHYIQTGRRERITSYEGLNGAPAWSPDGNRLAFVLSRDGNPEIYVMDLGSKQLRRVTNHFSIDTEPSWMDDNTIAFTSDRGGKPQIYKQNINGGSTERLTFVGNYNANAKLSVDGRTMVMVHRQEGYRNFQIATQDLKRGNLRVLTETSLDESPTVSPNGVMLIYATRQQGRGVLMLVSTNGRARSEIPTQFSDLRVPSWSPYLP